LFGIEDDQKLPSTICFYVPSSGFEDPAKIPLNGNTKNYLKLYHSHVNCMVEPSAVIFTN
jgi:hypothetical protein